MSKSIRYDWKRPGRDPRRVRKLVAKRNKRVSSMLKTIFMLNPFGGKV